PEAWTKVIGPFLLYCNSAPGHERMWKDALAKARTEQQAWPYAWVSDRAYPPASGRGAVTGTLVVSDPQAPRPEVRNLRVGLASPPYTPSPSAGASAEVDWQRDSKHYQFW